MDITKENIVDYVKSRLDFFEADGDVRVSAVGEGNPEEDGDGFINYVFRISDGTHSLIVKQSRINSRAKGPYVLDINRFKLEYESMKIRSAIVPDLIPKVYDCDEENRVIIVEDVSHLNISRFQLIKGVIFPHLADHIARYMAATEFYTSEYYLPTKDYRDLAVHFMNSTMRDIMDNVMFLSKVLEEDTIARPLDPDFVTFSKRVVADPDVLIARQKLRHLFMTKGECLIHGDLHTSNIFAGQDETKVIDMEYTFCGPFSYDLGYFTANFIAQYAAACFRPFPTEDARNTYKAYCLSMIRDTYLKFCDYFIEYWREDAKDVYKNIKGLEEDFRLTTLREFIGFAASPMLGRTCGDIAYPDFDSIEDYVQRHNAKCLGIIIDRQMLLKWESYQSIDELISDILIIEEIYCRNIKNLDK